MKHIGNEYVGNKMVFGCFEKMKQLKNEMMTKSKSDSCSIGDFRFAANEGMSKSPMIRKQNMFIYTSLCDINRNFIIFLNT